MTNDMIYTTEGWFNLAHVVQIQCGEGTDEGTDLIRLSDSRIIQCFIYDKTFLPPEPLAARAERAAAEPKAEVSC